MVETNDRKLPVGIQSFEKIRKEGCLYVDKTDIIWQLANKGKKHNYLIRPRRFGKSVKSVGQRTSHADIADDADFFLIICGFLTFPATFPQNLLQI